MEERDSMQGRSVAGATEWRGGCRGSEKGGEDVQGGRGGQMRGMRETAGQEGVGNRRGAGESSEDRQWRRHGECGERQGGWQSETSQEGSPASTMQAPNVHAKTLCPHSTTVSCAQQLPRSLRRTLPKLRFP